MENGFVKGLGLTGATTLVVGSMIGSGIFIAPSIMAGYLQSPWLVLLLWMLGGVFTLFGALSYGELAAAMPRVGGQYVFLREAYTPAVGFLYGWTLFLVIQTGFIAAVAVAFAKYLGVFLPSISETVQVVAVPLPGGRTMAINSAQVVGIASIALLTAINAFGVTAGAAVQNVFTFLKVAALGALILLGFASGKGSISNLGAVEPLVPASLDLGLGAALAVAFSKTLFAYDAWNTVTFAAEEIRDAPRNLPRALLLGTVVTTLVFTSATAVYFYLVPVGEAAAVADNRIAAAAAKVLFGPAGLLFIAAAILVSTFGCNNGLILGGPRVYYAMARDGLFFRGLGTIHPKWRTPVAALFLQAVWSCALTLSGTYSDLLTYTAFASVLFNMLTVAGLYVLRRRQPDLPRPYLAWGYPVVPALYIAIGLAFVVFVLQGDPRNSLLGFAIILLGLPAYLGFRRRSCPTTGPGSDKAPPAEPGHRASG